MAIQIITGDLANNKKQAVIERLIQIHEADPQGQIYYIVPEHLKFDMEKLMLETIAAYYGRREAGMIQIQVASFNRLGWFMTKNSGHQSHSVSSIGLSMIIRQVLAEEEENLQVYRGQIHYQGFVDKLLELFEELIRGNIQDQDLSDFVQEYFKDENSSDLLEKQRLDELILLFNAFNNKLQHFQLTQYHQMQQLIEALQTRDPQQNLYLVIDHYYYFNAEQMTLLINLAKAAKELWVTLPLPSYLRHSGNYHPMFDSVLKSYSMIKDIASLNHLPVKEDWQLDTTTYSYQEDLFKLSQAFKNSYDLNQQTPNPNIDIQKIPLEIWENDSIQTEIQHISNQIHYLISEQGYRYKDILVVTRDMERYLPIIKAYFSQNDIPVFIDHTTEMRYHPFVLHMEALLSISASNYSYEDLMAILNSQMIMPDFLKQLNLTQEDQYREKQHQLAYLENILLANGYFGYRLIHKDFKWSFPEADEIYIDAMGNDTEMTLGQMAELWRTWIIQNVFEPLQAYRKFKNGDQLARQLYLWVEKLGIAQVLLDSQESSDQIGQVEDSRRNEQVWQVFIQLLDEFYELYHDYQLSFHLFSELLMTGLNEATYHIIPATLDQVTVTNMVSPQVQPYPICFVMGMDNQAIPKFNQVQSLFGEEYRQALSDHLLSHQYLMDINQAQYSQELMLAYQLLLNGTEQLYLSYAKTANDQNLSISVYLENIIQISGIKPLSFNGGPKQDLKNLHHSDFGKYPVQKGNILKQDAFYYQQDLTYPKNFQAIIASMLEFEANHPEKEHSLLESFTKILQANELPKTISPQVAQDLYGDNLYLSVSRIEQYYQDPYSYFLTYGLALKERTVFELDARKTGNYAHEYLDLYSKYLQTDSQEFINLSNQELIHYDKLIHAKLKGDYNYNIFFSHPKFEAIYQNLKKNLFEFVEFVQGQNKFVPFKTLQSEAVFGLSSDSKILQALEYPLATGGKLYVRGKIDRIDEIRSQQDSYLQIIDYKSGKKEFKPVDVYYGLDLQILTYLKVALANYPEKQALGAFYQPIIHSFTKVEDLDKIQNQEAFNLGKHRLEGFVTIDEESLLRIDQSFDDSKNSYVYPANIKGDGSYNKNSKNYSQDELKLMLAYLDHLFVTAGNEILSGNIELAPFKEEKNTPSLNKDFRMISGFDATVNYQAYRQKVLKKDQLMEAISQILRKGGE